MHIHKICSTCKEDKPASEFGKDKRLKSGLTSQCYTCKRLSEKKYRVSEKGQKSKAEYRTKNRERITRKNKEWYIANREHVIYRVTEYERNNIQVRLRHNISKRISMGLKKDGFKKDKSVIEYVDYSMNQLVEHLEFQFEDWMNWDNYGNGDGCWSLDHIIPQSRYDFTNDLEISLCWNLRNLRPLSHKENITKNAKFDLLLIEKYGISDLLPGRDR